jgi:alpha-L-fucosidase
MPRTTSHPTEWYQDAKLGMFVHWGIYTVAGVEASWPIMAPDLSEAMFGTQKRITEEEYTALAQKFNPIDFNADAWVKEAKNAGVRYIVFTSKHHDGFCMFDAPGTDYKITNTPFGRDICKELSQACAKAGMKLGFYYSPPDMHHPGYRDTRRPATSNWLGEPKRKQWSEYLDYMESHIRKLLTDYGEVSVIWFDGLANHAKYDPARFHKLIHELNPNTLINDRLGDGYDFVTPEQYIPKSGIPVRTGKPPSSNDPGVDGFFRTIVSLFKVPGIRGWIRKQIEKYRDGTLELTPLVQTPYPSLEDFQPWETCMTMGLSWGYNPDEKNWKTPGELVNNLTKVADRGGNYLLNVGPTDRGVFPPEALERLEYIGQWMQRNGESIYGSTYSPIPATSNCGATRKGNKIYLHIWNWPSKGKLEFSTVPFKVTKISHLNGKSLPFTQVEHTLEITLPAQAPEPDVSVLMLEIDETDKGLSRYSPTKITKLTPWQYLKKQMIGSLWINSLINGLIALSSYRLRTNIPFAEGTVDVLISVAIIAFLTGWVGLAFVRSEIFKGNISQYSKKWKGWKMPKSSALGGLIVMAVSVIVLGGLVLDGMMALFAPAGFSNVAYIIFKTVYTGLAGAFACAVAILSVYQEDKGK